MGTVIHTSRSDCYKYVKGGFQNYNYEHTGGYSIVPCNQESYCQINYTACFTPDPITGEPIITVRCNIPQTPPAEGDNCNADANGVFINFWNNPFMIESECVMLDCYCIESN